MIVVTVGNTTFQGNTMLLTTNQELEEEPVFRQRIPFRMIIRNMFTVGDQNPVAFSDDNLGTIYPLIDRLNKKITAEELQMYAGTRCEIQCVYDRVMKTIRICSPILPVTLTPPCPQPPEVTQPEV